MGFFIFFLVGIAAMIVASFIFQDDKSFLKNIIISFVLAIFFTSIGTYRGCADGWNSSNIGSQGACSHHGGVSTFVNIYGTYAIVISIMIIALTFIWATYFQGDVKKDKNIDK